MWWEGEWLGFSRAVPGLEELDLGLAVSTFDFYPEGSKVMALGGFEVGLPGLAFAIFIAELEKNDTSVGMSVGGLIIIQPYSI